MNHRPIFYDTETTGLKAEFDKIIEFAAYDPILDRSFVTLINPGCPIPSQASAIHNITDDMVASAPGFGAIINELTEFCSGDTILIAHNNDAFDRPFLDQEFKRNNGKMPEWKFLDSLKWARRYRPDLPRHTLQFLREIYNIPANNAHRALDDVKVLHQVFSKMTGDLPIMQAYELLNQPTVLQHMPFGKHQGVPLSKLPGSYIQWLASSGAFDKPDNKALKEALQKLGLL
jgi:DNA polymerase III subunit epsilon